MNTIPISDILVSDRQRKDLGDLEFDFSSVREVGLIQPIVIEPYNGKWRLVTGGRRLTWLSRNGYDKLFHGVTCDPGRPGYVLASELTEQQKQEAELYENLKRKSLPWTEECLAIAKIHRFHWLEKKANALEWSQKHTASLLGFSGYAKVCYALQIADELRDNPDGPMSHCEQYSDAVKILLSRKDEEVRREQDRRRALLMKPPETIINEEGQLIVVHQEPLPEETTIVQVWLSNMLFHGDFSTIAETDMPPDFFPCALVFGKDDSWMDQTARLLKANAYVLWFGCDSTTYALRANHYDLRVIEWPVIWSVLGGEADPNHPFANNQRKIVVLEKGNPVPANPSASSVVTANQDGEYPPTSVIDFLLKAVTINGDNILMPTGGPVERMLEVGRIPTCFDANVESHNANVEGAKRHYEGLHSGQVEFK